MDDASAVVGVAARTNLGGDTDPVLGVMVAPPLLAVMNAFPGQGLGPLERWLRLLGYSAHMVEELAARCRSGAGTASGLRLEGLERLLWRLLAVYGVLVLVCLALVPHLFLPAEDAVILFQYSRNLAEHGGIAFLAGGAHVEGATDFAWMALLAAAIRVGIPAFWFCAAANVLSLAGLAAALSRMARIRLTLTGVLAVAGSAALFPQIFAAASGFGVLPDALLLTWMVLCVMEGRPNRASLGALAFCLFRPDGVVFAVPLLAGMVMTRAERWQQNVLCIGGFFLLPGTTYFLWRWHYFGELFPLPFLVKSQAQRVLGMFVWRSVRASLAYLVFAALALAPLRLLKARRWLWLAVPLVVVPTAFYWAMRLDQDVGARFFYYLPLAAAILLAANWDRLRARGIPLVTVVLAAWLPLLAMPLYRELRTFRDEQFATVKSIAEALGRLPRRGKILTSEAGFLPYFSGWTTYDAWGLNTPAFAHRFIRGADVEGLGADLVVLHPDRTESCLRQADWLTDYDDRSWVHMTRSLVEGAAPPQYELWLTSYGSEFYRARKRWSYGEGDRECWLVRRDSPLYAGIAQVLRENHGVSPAEAEAMEQRLAEEGR